MTKGQVKDRLIADAVADGWTIEKADDTGVAILGIGTDMKPRVWNNVQYIQFDPAFWPMQFTRIRYRIEDLGPDAARIALVAQVEVVEDPGSAAELVSNERSVPGPQMNMMKTVVRNKLDALFPRRE